MVLQTVSPDRMHMRWNKQSDPSKADTPRPARATFLEFKQEQLAKKQSFAKYLKDALPEGVWEPHAHMNRSYHIAKEVMNSPWFDRCIGLVILANSITIGIEQHHRIHGRHSALLAAFESMFLVIYMLELALRFYVLRCKALLDPWIVFDCFLVGISVGTEWVLEPVFGNAQVAPPLMIVRTARSARLARTFRLMGKCRQLWMLIHSFMLSFSMVVYTLILLALFLYILGILGVESIRLDPHYDESDTSVYSQVAKTYFSSLPVTMLSLMQFVCMDSIGQIYKPLVEKRPALIVYFVAVIVVVAIVFMSIVTAVLVNGSLEQAAKDKENLARAQKKNKLSIIKILYGMFERLDVDGSGCVDRSELINACEEDRGIVDQLLGITDPLSIFDQLDVDGGGTLDIDEFCEGLYECSVSKHPIIIKRIDKQVAKLRKDVGEILRHIAPAHLETSVNSNCSWLHAPRVEASNVFGIKEDEPRIGEQIALEANLSSCNVFDELQILKDCVARLEIELLENRIRKSCSPLPPVTPDRNVCDGIKHDECNDNCRGSLLKVCDTSLPDGDDTCNPYHEFGPRMSTHQVPIPSSVRFDTGNGYLDRIMEI